MGAGKDCERWRFDTWREPVLPGGKPTGRFAKLAEIASAAHPQEGFLDPRRSLDIRLYRTARQVAHIVKWGNLICSFAQWLSFLADTVTPTTPSSSIKDVAFC
jgi:hypothetical protein